jgi:hypothetical protein
MKPRISEDPDMQRVFGKEKMNVMGTPLEYTYSNALFSILLTLLAFTFVFRGRRV